MTYFRNITLCLLLIGTLVLGTGLTKQSAIQQLILAYIQNGHFDPIPIDDAFSEQVFDLYIERLDPAKQFLIQSDINRLRRFRTAIDDDIHRGRTTLMTDATKILKKRQVKVQSWYPEMLKAPSNFDQKQVLETDVDKRAHAPNILALKLFWKKYIKYQVLNQYLILYDNTYNKQVTRNIAVTSTPNKKIKKVKKDPYTLDMALEKEAREKVKKNLDQLFERLLEEDKDGHFSIYMDSILNIFDAHTAYFAPEKKEEFDISISGKLEGIGAVLKEDNGQIKVVRIVTGSAAWRQGELKADDIILKVAEGDGEPISIEGSRVRDAVKLIRGKKGDEVRLTVKKPIGKVIVIPIVRDIVVIEATYAKAAVITNKDDNRRLGYIHIPKFYRDFEDNSGRNTTDDTRRLIELLKKDHDVAGILLDLRHNEGGALLDAIQTAGLFIETGPIVQVRGRSSDTNQYKNQVYKDTDPEINYKGPLVILHNMYSASASEILAGALQDYGRAIIVGSNHSFGKGTVQTFIKLDAFKQFAAQFKPMGALKLTIQKFYRINGDSTQYKGVVSDIILPNNQKSLEVGEEHLTRSLPWSRTVSTDYTPLNTNLYRKKLKKKSLNRTKRSPQFKALNKHLTFIEDQQEETKRPLSLVAAYDIKEAINKESKTYEKNKEGASRFTIKQIKDPLTKDIDKDTVKAWEKALGKNLYFNESIAILKDLIEFTNRDRNIVNN